MKHAEGIISLAEEEDDFAYEETFSEEEDYHNQFSTLVEGGDSLISVFCEAIQETRHFLRKEGT
jgi:hypothetical protein